MSPLKKILIASVAAVALCTPALCSATTVSGGSTTGLGSFLSRLVSQLPQQQTITVAGGSSGSGGLIIVVNPPPGNPLSQLSQNAIPSQHAINGWASGAAIDRHAPLNILQNTKGVLISSHAAEPWLTMATAPDSNACTSIPLTLPYSQHPLQR